MSAYRETFLRHRTLLVSPVVLAVVLAVWTAAGTPPAYQSSASLWVDSPAPGPSSLTETNPTLRPPAEQQQLLLDELLQTRRFTLAVGRGGPLADYLAAHPVRGWSPMALLARVRGRPGLDAQILGELAPGRVASKVAGPQVLQITYRGPTPRVVAATLRSLLDQFERQRSKLGLQRGQITLAYYRDQVDGASKAVMEARSAVLDHLRRNPGATSSSDPHLRAAMRAEQAAGRTLSRATAKLNQVTSDLRESGSRDTGLRVIDAPRAPEGPVRGKKMLLIALVGGLFAGGLVSCLGLIALTPAKPDDWDLPAAEIDRLVYGDPANVASLPHRNGDAGRSDGRREAAGRRTSTS